MPPTGASPDEANDRKGFPSASLKSVAKPAGVDDTGVLEIGPCGNWPAVTGIVPFNADDDGSVPRRAGVSRSASRLLRRTLPLCTGRAFSLVNFVTLVDCEGVRFDVVFPVGVSALLLPALLLPLAWVLLRLLLRLLVEVRIDSSELEEDEVDTISMVPSTITGAAGIVELADPSV